MRLYIETKQYIIMINSHNELVTILNTSIVSLFRYPDDQKREASLNRTS